MVETSIVDGVKRFRRVQCLHDRSLMWAMRAEALFDSLEDCDSVARFSRS